MAVLRADIICWTTERHPFSRVHLPLPVEGPFPRVGDVVRDPDFETFHRVREVEWLRYGGGWEVWVVVGEGARKAEYVKRGWHDTGCECPDIDIDL